MSPKLKYFSISLRNVTAMEKGKEGRRRGGRDRGREERLHRSVSSFESNTVRASAGGLRLKTGSTIALPSDVRVAFTRRARRGKGSQEARHLQRSLELANTAKHQHPLERPGRSFARVD